MLDNREDCTCRHLIYVVECKLPHGNLCKNQKNFVISEEHWLNFLFLLFKFPPLREIQFYFYATKLLFLVFNSIGDSIFTAGKPAILANNTLIRGSKALNKRRPITSSSSTISSLSTNNAERDRKDKTLKEDRQQRYLIDSSKHLVNITVTFTPSSFMCMLVHHLLHIFRLNTFGYGRVMSLYLLALQIHRWCSCRCHHWYTSLGDNNNYTSTHHQRCLSIVFVPTRKLSYARVGPSVIIFLDVSNHPESKISKISHSYGTGVMSQEKKRRFHLSITVSRSWSSFRA